MAPPVDSTTHCEPDDTTGNCGIEMTPEMIEAGEAAVRRIWWEEEPSEEIARKIFVAMICAMKKKSSTDS